MSVHPLIQNYLDATAQEPKLPAIGIDTAREGFRRKSMSLAGASRALPITIADYVIGGPAPFPLDVRTSELQELFLAWFLLAFLWTVRMRLIAKAATKTPH